MVSLELIILANAYYLQCVQYRLNNVILATTLKSIECQCLRVHYNQKELLKMTTSYS